MDKSSDFFVAVLNFLFLFGLILLLAWAAARFMGARMGLSARGGPLRVLQHIPAGRDRSIMLLEAGGKIYLLGVTPEQVTLLDAIAEPDAIARILQAAQAPPANALQQVVPASFAAILGKLTGRAPQPGDPPPEGGAPEAGVQHPDEGRLRDQIDRLRQITKR